MTRTDGRSLSRQEDRHQASVQGVFGGVDQVLLDLDSGLRIQDLKKDKDPMQNADLPYQREKKEKG